MSEWTETDRRVGLWSATTGAAIIVVYITTGLVGFTARPPGPNPLREVDPYLAILEILIILAALDLVILMAVVYAYAPADRKTFALAALTFVLVLAALTCGVHFVSLSVGRQASHATSTLLSHQLLFGEQWPTLTLSLDLLAWDFFLGLSLVFAAPVFKGEGLIARVCIGMIVAGSLCLIATLGPASGNMQIQYLGIAGYDFVLPVVCILLAMLFRQAKPSGSSQCL